MKILVKRTDKTDRYTIGDLYIDNEYICNTLEDTDRGLKQTDSIEHIQDVKVFGETAIPTGTYEVDMDTVSPKFKDRIWAQPYKGKLPRLVNVPGFEGVLIHVLNTVEESLGCLGVGNKEANGTLSSSTSMFHTVMRRLLSKNEPITITIE